MSRIKQQKIDLWCALIGIPTVSRLVALAFYLSFANNSYLNASILVIVVPIMNTWLNLPPIFAFHIMSLPSSGGRILRAQMYPLQEIDAEEGGGR